MGIPGADSEASSGVAEGDEEGHLGARLHHGRDADAPRQQLVGHAQEAVARPRYRAAEAPIWAHVAGRVQQRPPLHTNICAMFANKMVPFLGDMPVLDATNIGRLCSLHLARLHPNMRHGNEWANGLGCTWGY